MSDEYKAEYHVEAKISFLPTEDGGRKGSVQSQYMPQFRYDGKDWDARHYYPENEVINPGESVKTLLSFLTPENHVGKLAVGMNFEIAEGARVVAKGVITKLLDLNKYQT